MTGLIVGRLVVVDTCRSSGMMPTWVLLLGDRGVSVNANIGCGAVVVAETRILLNRFVTLFLAWKNYRALST